LDSKIFEVCLEKYQNRDMSVSWQDLAERFGYENGDQLRSSFKMARKKMGIPSHGIGSTKTVVGGNELPHYKETVEIKGNGEVTSDRLIEICEEDSKSPESVMIAHKFDPTKWRLVICRNNLWHMQKKGGTRLLCYQSRITVAPRKPNEITFAEVDKFFNKYTPKVHAPKRGLVDHIQKGRVLEICIPDLHVGADSADPNRSDESIKDAFAKVIKDIYYRINGRDLDKIYLVFMGDIMHYDTANKTTTSGTQISSNMNFPNIFEIATSMIIDGIDLFSGIAPVEVPYIKGNHDGVAGYMLMKSIENYYRMDDNVVIDSDPISRKFRKIGNSLIGWCHGNMAKANITTWLQKEARKEYGETKYAEVHAGHFHSQNTVDKDGIVLRYLPTITPTDSWHYDRGFVGAVKSTISFLWGSDGLLEMWFSNV